MSLTNKAKLVDLYKRETDSKANERLMLIIRVREDGHVPFRVVKEMDRSIPWASDWIKRYDDECTGGLRCRVKSGRPPELSEEACCPIKK
jgi:transposase